MTNFDFFGEMLFEEAKFYLEIAKNNVRIKVVYMNGSRINENVPKDMFQDYDKQIYMF